MSSIHVWQTELYDKKLDFVSEFGKGVVELLNPTQGETVLDLGCGTGDLADEISKAGADVIGMDLSASMIAAAKEKYPALRFRVGDATSFKLEEEVDAVFSNAALHWVKEPEKVIACIWDALRQGGRFVAEFGGQGNVETVVKAASRVLERDYGIDASALNPWYFPSIAQYSTLLEQQGFRVTYAVHFDRPTRMKDGDDGLKIWLTGLADDLFKGLSAEEKSAAIAKIEAEARPELYHDEAWYIDYKRIRFMAIKA
ncbi:trans-aconitate methyltransferase [Paenibacillus taihuensis]|uniref:Trans-aconitate methyltransferase n=1 Tax=Paenibacillus taihuensis TaxID=1156355 RepID=A0A3D9RRG9_9BACL|nr:class I SAM-dependent methyltransferase [Paenibacillus taihuensis]REE78681.1 trans-aconitate methyltransferase [Paenibacillus taihuensis]